MANGQDNAARLGLATPSSAALHDLFAPIADDLARANQVFQQELHSEKDHVARLCAHVERFRGKQIRPALVLLSARASGGIRPAHHVLAAVVELVHIATLVHDDVLDEADLRRRTETVSRRWGNESAVLLGDLLFSHAYRLCSTLDSQFAALQIGQTAVDLCAGELLQVSSAGRRDLSEAEYFEIIEGKTASLIATCCLLGSYYAGADEATVEALRRYGRDVGLAFQITDDLLDLLGSEQVVGKSLGRDIEKGKLTLPLIHCLTQAPPRCRQELLNLLEDRDPRRYRRIAELLQSAGSVTYAQQAARGLIEQAVEQLDKLPDGPDRQALRTLAEFVVARWL